MIPGQELFVIGITWQVAGERTSRGLPPPLGTRNRNHPTGFNLCVFECFWLRAANSNKIRLLLQFSSIPFLFFCGEQEGVKLRAGGSDGLMVVEVVQLVVLLQFQPHLLLFSCFCGLLAIVIQCLGVHQFGWQLSHVFLFLLFLFPCHNEVKSICLPEGFVIKQIKCRRKLLGCVPYFCCQKIGVEKTAANVSLIITNDIRFIFYANLGRNSIFELSALYLHKFELWKCLKLLPLYGREFPSPMHLNRSPEVGL